MTDFHRIVSTIDRFANILGPEDDPEAWTRAQNDFVNSLDVSHCLQAIEHFLKVFRSSPLETGYDRPSWVSDYLGSVAWMIGQAIERLRDPFLDDFIARLLRRGVGIRFVLEVASHTQSHLVFECLLPYLDHAVCISNRTSLTLALSRNADSLDIENLRRRLSDSATPNSIRRAIEETIREWQLETGQSLSVAVTPSSPSY